jgi:copper(I)-binding protein
LSQLLNACILAALIAFAPPTALAGENEIRVTRAWSRATVGSGGNGVVYLTIENTSGQVERIAAVSTPVAVRASVHETVRRDGMMQMLPTPNLEIAPASRLELKPGGLHVMLMGLRAPIVQGSRFPLTIRFERAGVVEVEVVAGSVGALDAPDPSDTGQE